MKICVYGYTANKPEWKIFMQRFTTGISKFSECEYINDRIYKECDYAVIFGSFRRDKDKKKTDYHKFKGEILRQNCKVIYIESALLNRIALVRLNTHWRVGVGGFMMDGDFGFRDNPPRDRLDMLDINPAPWKTDGSYVLLAMQLLKDASLFGTDHKKGAEDTTLEILNKTTLPVRIRLHPLTNQIDHHRMFSTTFATLEEMKRVSFSPIDTPLAEDFSNAKCMVNVTSGSGIDAAIAGVPVISMDWRSMASPFSTRTLDIDNLIRPDRTHHLRNLAYAQWTPAEMESGECWKHLLDNSINK